MSAYNKFDYTYVDPTLTSSQWACATGSDDEFVNVPYGTYCSSSTYDSETFASESVDVCKWTARRLGHPVMQIEMNSGSIYAMFEESVSEYSQHINNYNIKNWMWTQYGASTGSDHVSGSTGSYGSSVGNNSGATMPNNMGTTFILSDQYGSSAGVGGDVTMYSGSITLTGSKQTYDLKNQDSFELESDWSSDKTYVIQQIHHRAPAAMTKFWDPYVGTYDQRMMLDQFGFASYSPATTFIMRPMYYDIMRAQAIETSDVIRKSNYSFEIINNRVKLFPLPTANDDGSKVWFEYYVRDEISDSKPSYASGKVTDPSNAPYQFLNYQEINANGRQWIRKYTLALSKELLGIIRSKYASMPLPNGEVTLDGEALKAEGREEKMQLLEELKEFLDSVSLTEKSRAEAEEANANQEVLSKSPLGIYLG